MKLIIDIPKEFETDYKGDKFKDFFSRVLCDIDKGVLCGNYEKETTEMFLKAFDESVTMANIVEKLEEEFKKKHNKERDVLCKIANASYSAGVKYAINIVKQEIKQEN